MTDGASLVEASAGTDFAAFSAEVYPRLVATLTVVCSSRPVAEEIGQDALVRAWQRWGAVGKHPDPTAWVFRVALNLASSWWRRRLAERRAHQRVGPAGPALQPDFETHRIVWDAVATLPTRQRHAVILRHVTGLSVAETAAAMTCAEGTVKALTSQGLARLRPLLEDS